MDETDSGDGYGNMVADGESQPIYTRPPATDYMSGALQAGLALGTSYLSRRIDIDLQSRLTGMQPTVQRPSNQRQITGGPDVTTRAVAAVGGIQLGNLLPWAVAGFIGWMVLGKRG